MITVESTKRKMAKRKVIMSETKWNNLLLDARTLEYYRNNPCIAAEDLLGVRLVDSQKYIIQSTWNAINSIWACSRNFGKSFMIAVMAILKAALYENQNIYIISSVGPQAKETFTKIEELILREGRTSESIGFRGANMIAEETVKSTNSKTGFTHSPESYAVSFYNGSTIYTLNSKPNNLRSKRATVVFFDEAAFCSEEILTIARAFGAQDTNFKTSTDDNYDIRKRPKQVPTQMIYASSQDDMNTIFYKNYKDWAKQMIAGNRDFFVCDMPCDTAIQVFMNGHPYQPLLSQDTVDTALRENREKALREYYNVPTLDGGPTQIIKWGTIRQNEKLILPYCSYKSNHKIALAFDPARTTDNSILSAMRIYEDPELGTCGDIIGCTNFVDVTTKKKLKLDSNRQVALIRQILLNYNGEEKDYDCLDYLLVDAGAGGGGVSAYADRLLEDWVDGDGNTHFGLIDKTSSIYSGYSKIYRNAVDKLRLISPVAYRTQMVQEFIELFNLGVIKLPYEYTGQDFIRIPKIATNDSEEEGFDIYYLSDEEKIHLNQIDLMKHEIAAIHKVSNAENTSERYVLPKEKEGKMHDDRFYTMIMLAHRLYEIRRRSTLGKKKKKENKDISTILQIRAPKLKQ